MSACAQQEAVNQAYQKLMVDAEGEAAAPVPTQHFCWLLNESICEFSTSAANANQVSYSLLVLVLTGFTFSSVGFSLIAHTNTVLRSYFESHMSGY